MRRRLWVALLAACGVATGEPAARAQEVTAEYRLIPEYQRSNASSPFYLPESFARTPQERLRQDLTLHARWGALTLSATGTALSQEGERPDYDGVLNELFLEHDAGGLGLTAGKKVVGWGVGFGFRPLDVVQRERRQTLLPPPPEGVPLLALQGFDATTAWTLVYANPTRDLRDEPRDDEALAARLFHTAGATDLHGVLRLSERNRLQAGLGFATVVGDAWAGHGSLLYLRRYERRIHPLAATGEPLLARQNPLETRTFRNGVQGLLGVAYTSPGGLSWLAEVWYDDEAYRAEEWRQLLRLTERQRQLLGQPGVPEEAVLGNVGFNAGYFDAPNLLRENVLLRVAHTGTRWEPALELLHTPQDGGWAATARLNHTGNRYRIEGAVRRFGGPRESAYRLLPVETIVVLGVTWAFG